MDHPWPRLAISVSRSSFHEKIRGTVALTAVRRASTSLLHDRVALKESPVTSLPLTPGEVDRVFREHGEFVWRSLRRLGLSEADADDICQEVFVVVFRKLADFEQRSSLRAWLYGIAVRLAASHRRRASTQREVPTETLPEATEPREPDDRLVASEARRLLDLALDNLDDDKRAVFVLFEIEELPMTQIATALECPLQTAYSRLYAARERVESFLVRTAKGWER